ncbi:hypothetical protein KKG56_03615, partial [bacterium]|nr:hypothetical protein [bacterium]
RLICDNLFGDFPFDDEADLAHAVAALVLVFTRRMIDGPTPLHLIEAPAPGTGKTLLAELISLISTGRKPEAIALQPREEEVNKLLGSELARGRPIVLLDNLDHT